MAQTSEQQVDNNALRYVTKVITALGAAGIGVPEYEIEFDEVRKAYIQLGAADPDTGREVHLCWTEESGWYRGIDQNGSGVLNLLRWAHLGVLPDATAVATWAADQAAAAATPEQMTRPRYRDADGEDGFEAELVAAGRPHASGQAPTPLKDGS